MAEINESIDSNIEVKMNDPSPPSSTTTTTTTISINDSAVTINNAKRIISTHLETSTTLINFKNLDDIINAAIILLSKQANEFDTYKKKQDDLVATLTNDKKKNDETISTLELRIVSLEESNKKGKAEIEGLLAERIKEVKSECKNEIDTMKTSFDERISQQDLVIQKRDEVIAQNETSIKELKDRLQTIEIEKDEVQNKLDEKFNNVTNELKESREMIEDYATKLRETMEVVEKLNGPIEDKSLDRLQKKINEGQKKINTMSATRKELTNEINECTNVLSKAQEQIMTEPDASSWEQIEQILTSMLEISTSLRDTFSPGLTRYAIESVHLEKYLEDLELETQILNIDPTIQGKCLDQIRSNMMEFQQEKEHRDEMVKQVEALAKSLTNIWRNWAVYARDCAKAMTIEEAKNQIGTTVVKNGGGGGGGGGVSKADLDRIRREAEREAAKARRAAGRVASKKALEETQKQIEATANRLTKAVKVVRDSTEDVATVVKRLEQEFSHANQETEILKSGLATAKNDIIELNNNAMHMQHDIEETRSMIPEPTPPYDDTEIKNQLEFHSKELIDVIAGVDTLKESEGKFDAEIKGVFEEHASQIAHLLATKADARSTELALKEKAPIALEHQVKDFVKNLVQKIHDKDKVSNKKSRSQRASLEARILKLVTGSLNRIREQQRHLHQIIGPFNTKLGGFGYKCLACDRPADNYMPFQHGHHEHQLRRMSNDVESGNRSRNSLNIEASQSLMISPIPGGKGLQQVGTRRYGGKINQRMAQTDTAVNFEDPGIQARRNLHTYSPYRTVGAGFRVNNKAQVKQNKDFLVSNSPGNSYRKRPQTAPQNM